MRRLLAGALQTNFWLKLMPFFLVLPCVIYQDPANSPESDIRIRVLMEGDSRVLIGN